VQAAGPVGLEPHRLRGADGVCGGAIAIRGARRLAAHPKRGVAVGAAASGSLSGPDRRLDPASDRSRAPSSATASSKVHRVAAGLAPARESSAPHPRRRTRASRFVDVRKRDSIGITCLVSR
jgi:hypothetical protein